MRTFSHWTFASWKLSAVIPQTKIKDFCQLPFAREPAACRRCQCARWLSTIRYCPSNARYRYRVEIEAPRQSPPCQRGVPRLAEAGGFPRQSLRNFLPIPSSLFPKKPSPFHMSLYFGKVPTVNLSHGCAVPAPFRKGAFLCPVSAARRPFGAKRSLLQIYATGSFFTKW